MKPHAPSADETRVALHEHLVDKATSARLRHGLLIDADAILRILTDRETVRYPVEIAFDASPLEPGEFAYPQPLGEQPSDGFRLCLHPWFEPTPEVWPLLIAYHIPTINYGEIGGPAEAELFGATLLGFDREEYYNALCELADSIPGEN